MLLILLAAFTTIDLFAATVGVVFSSLTSYPGNQLQGSITGSEIQVVWIHA